jgi:hypothetical protein
MAMRSHLALVLLTATAGVAAADTFAGFSGVDRYYLVNADKVCAPLAVEGGTATGAPKCEKQAADVVAKLSVKEPISQKGVKGAFDAKASGRTLTVTKKTGEALVTWTAADPIGRIVDVYASQYEDRVAVAYTTRRLGKEVTDVVAFELVKTTGRSQPAGPTSPDATRSTQPAVVTPPEDPNVMKAVEVARKAPKAKALVAWNGVLAIDPMHSEANYRIAALELAAKRRAEAIASLEKLSTSTRADAVEWQVEARFDKAFAAVRADPKFRAAVGLDRAPANPYERLMGLGGQWEQAETHCDKPQVKLAVSRDRSVKLRIASHCRGSSYEVPFKGTWRINDDGSLTLTFPTKGKAVTAKDEAPCTFEKQGEEDALHCVIDEETEFTVLPTRR